MAFVLLLLLFASSDSSESYISEIFFFLFAPLINFLSKSLMSLSSDLIALSYDVVLFWNLVCSSLVLNIVSFSFWMFLTVMFADHFYMFERYHSIRKSAVFFKLSRCFYLNFRCYDNLASVYFYACWLVITIWCSWKSENFFSTFYWLMDFCAGCN